MYCLHKTLTPQGSVTENFQQKPNLHKFNSELIVITLLDLLNHFRLNENIYGTIIYSLYSLVLIYSFFFLAFYPSLLTFLSFFSVTLLSLCQLFFPSFIPFNFLTCCSILYTFLFLFQSFFLSFPHFLTCLVVLPFLYLYVFLSSIYI